MSISENKKVLVYIAIAFLFSFFLRLIWVYQFQDIDAFKFNGQFMLNTNDGYFWAEGARDFLAGVQSNERSPISRLPSILAAFISKYLGIQLETVLFYLPAIISSFLVIPIILISKLFNEVEAGFIAALLGSIAWSYYNRTMVGYYDTDFLNILLPTILLWSLIWAVKTSENKYYLIASIDTIVYRLWYPQSYSLELAFIALLLCYVVYLKVKKQDINSSITLITFLLFAMMSLDSLIRLSIVVVLFVFFKINKTTVEKYIYFILASAFLLFLITGGIEPVLSKLNGYVFRESVQSVNQGLGLHFYSVMQTVREAGHIPFETFSNRISGSIFGLVISILGYLIFAYRYPLFLLSLPMVGLGFLAFSGGLRFTIYAVPIMALGAGYFIVVVSKYISGFFERKSSFVKPLIISILTVSVLSPNVKHIIEYKIPTVFTKEEVKLLDKLKALSSAGDYMVSWWDYGYPIRYYSNTRTLIDGGKHGGKVNFPISFMLTNPQHVSAKMARLDVEYTQKRINLVDDSDINFASSNIEQIILDNGYKNSNDFLLGLENGYVNFPEETRDIYFYLPSRMLNIFPTISLFSNLDLMTGKQNKKPFFYQSSNIRDSKEIIDLGNGIKILKRKGILQVGNKSIKINKFISTSYNAEGSLNKHIQTIDTNSNLNIIYMKNYNKFIVLDNKMLNSLFIQLFVLENYNKEYFEPVILNPYAKIYKLKI